MLEINKGIALLKDSFPNMENERNLLIEILKTGVWKSLLELKFKNRQEQEAGIEECKKNILENTFIKEEIARKVLVVITTALIEEKVAEMIAPEVAKVAESLPITEVIPVGENAVISDETSSVESNKQDSYSFVKMYNPKAQDMVNVAKMVINAYDSVDYGDPDKAERAKDMEDTITNTINNTLSSVSGILGMFGIK